MKQLISFVVALAVCFSLLTSGVLAAQWDPDNPPVLPYKENVSVRPDGEEGGWGETSKIPAFLPGPTWYILEWLVGHGYLIEMVQASETSTNDNEKNQDGVTHGKRYGIE